ncbi:MAG: hypothetical protein HYS78_00375 [Parcubacteria group bacterium]|nr:hypothetical protein [Parcubacteria group bacterium]
MSKSICENEKYQLGGPQEDVIGLSVSMSGLPEKIEVEGQTLFLKTSFHVSLVCIGKVIEKHNISTPGFINKVVDDFCEFTRTDSINFFRYRNEFRFASQNDRCSVIAMCDVSNLDRFFQIINQKYGLKIEYPPTHVTIYTLQPDKGIFITDSKDIKKLTKPIIIPGLVLT